MSEPKRILIVEDEPLIAMMLEDFLEVLDKRPAGTADSVSAAKVHVEDRRIDAALGDEMQCRSYIVGGARHLLVERVEEIL